VAVLGESFKLVCNDDKLFPIHTVSCWNRRGAMKLLRIVLSIVVPPVGVFLTYGLSSTLIINVLLTLLGYLPGMIHGVWAVTKHYDNVGQGV
jgi:uncharacterized membrane protein YqaE (UPF0057 family)